MSRELLRIPVVAALAAAATASAEPGFDVQTRAAVHDGSGLFTAYGSSVLSPGAAHVGLVLDDARDPLLLEAGDVPLAPIVSRATGMELGGAVGLPFRLQAGMVVPYARHVVPNDVDPDGEEGVARSGMGDLRGELKWQALAASGHRPGVALLGGATLPTGDAEGYFGSGAARPYALVCAEERLGPVTVVLNGGYRAAPEADLLGVPVGGNALLWRTGASVATPLAGLTVIGEAFGADASTGKTAEAGLGLRIPLPASLQASVAYYRGFGSAVGTPETRIAATLAWTFERVPSRAAVQPSLGAPAPRPSPPATRTAPPVSAPTPAPVAAVAATPAATPFPMPSPTSTPVTIVKDTDSDGVPDDRDTCVSEPGPASTGGCPYRFIVLKKETKRIELLQMIHFAFNRATILKESHPVLGEIADVLRNNPALEVRIEGHTDSDGKAAENLKLSKSRADAVRAYLLRAGIAASRLKAVGFGETQFLVPETSPAAKELNRRVEFHIVKQ